MDSNKIEIEDVPADDLRLKLLLTNAINTQKEVFLKCEAFIAALVLDPRFCFTSCHQLFNTELLNSGITQLIKIHQKLCTRREQSNSSSTEESIQLNASYSSNTSEEMIPMNSEDVEAEKASTSSEFIGIISSEAVLLNILEEEQDKASLMHLQNQMKIFVN